MGSIWISVFTWALVATEATHLLTSGTTDVPSASPIDEVTHRPAPDTMTQTPADTPTTKVSTTDTSTILAPTMAAAGTSSIKDFRLPSSVTPIKYLIRLQPFINGNFTIKGSAEITISVSEKTKNITLHIADIITKNETIRINPLDDLVGPGLKIVQHKYDKDREFYIAMLEQDLMAGKQYVVYMEFEGLLDYKTKGFLRSEYTEGASGKHKLLAATQFQPTDARRAFPCFDEPALKAEFEVFLGRQTNMSSISNMPRIETTPIEGQPGWVWDHFNTSVPMSTYLVAFVVSDFTYINSTSNPNTLFRVWTREEAISQAEYSRRIGPEVLTYFETYFKTPFPLPKQDMIAIPTFSGAMENWGLITYGESALLYDPAMTSAADKQRTAAVVAHELAHQWFGNLVTPFWWTDLWLNEGFATYLQYLGVDAVEPTWNMLEQFSVIALHSVFTLDCLESSHPISIPVGHPNEISEIFDGISYLKGASIIRMMNHFLSESTLRKGLTNYLSKFKYGSAEQDDLWLYLTQQAHTDGTLPKDITVKTIMDTWTLQMGYPVITVTRQRDGTAKLTQERFQMAKNANSTDTHDYKWWVPISFVTEEDNNFNQTKPSSWMADTESVKTISGMPSADKWVIFNVQQTGYYKVNYDTNNWQMIIRQLKTDHTKINVINRAQIIDDAIDLARAGLLTYDIAFEVLSYLNKETEYVPWKAALDNLEYIKNMLQRTATYGAFKRYLLSLLLSLYNAVGFDDDLNDPHLDQLKRALAIRWACDLGHKDCIQKSVALFARWRLNPGNERYQIATQFGGDCQPYCQTVRVSIVSPNQKSRVYCHGIAEGGEEEWEFGWMKYKESNVATEREIIMRALGCTKEIWILYKYLDMAFAPDSGVKKPDSIRIFLAITENDIGRDLAWNYLREHWSKIASEYFFGLNRIAAMPRAASKKFSTNFMLNELIKFRDDNAQSLTPIQRTVAQCIERVSNNVDWADTHYQVIVDWLRQNGYDGASGKRSSERRRP